MDRPAAIAGSFSDFKIVKTRSTAQLIIEIPIEAADEALQVLGGVPQSGKENPVAVARLRPGAVLISDDEATTPLEPAVDVRREAYIEMLRQESAPQAPEKPASGPNGDGVDKHRLSRQAALCCQDARFWRFMEEHYDITIHDANEVAAAVRRECDVESRAEFDTDPKAAARWRDLDWAYRAWLTAP